MDKKYLIKVANWWFEVTKEEYDAMKTDKNRHAALDSINTEFTEYDDTIVRRLVSKVRIISQDKVVVTLCGSLDIEQQI